MLERLATFVHRNSRRVLLVAVVAVAIAGTFGIGVTKQLSPYGATDPSTQSVQASSRYQAAAGRQIDPGVIALVTIGDIHSASAERRVHQVEAELRSSRDVAAVFELLRQPRPRHARPRPALDLRRRVLPAEVGLENRRRRLALGKPVRQPARRQARRPRDRQRPSQHAGQARPRARGTARVPDHLPALAAVLPLARRGPAATAARRTRDLGNVLRVAGRLELHRPFGVRAQPRDRSRARACDRLQPVHGLPLPRGVRPPRVRRPRAAPHARHRGTDDRVQLADGRRGTRVTRDLPATVPLLDGDRGRTRRADRSHTRAPRPASHAVRARTTRERARPKPAPARRRPRRPAGRSGLLVPALAVRDPAPAEDRRAQRGGADRARDPVPVDQVPARRRKRAPREHQRAPGRPGATHRVPAWPNLTTRDRRRRPRRIAATEGVRRPDPRPAGCLRGRSRAARGAPPLPPRRRTLRTHLQRGNERPRPHRARITGALLRRRRRPDRRIRRPRTQPRSTPAHSYWRP